MNISPLTIYLWQLADQLLSALGIATTISFVTLVVLLIFSTCPCDSVSTTCKASIKKSLLAVFVIGGFKVIVPSSNTIAMMIVIPEIAHSKVVQQDLPDIYNAAVKALKDQLTK